MTAMHPFGGETPETFIDLGLDGEGSEVVLGERIAQWIDVQVFAVPEPPANVEPLPFPGPMSVNEGDVIVLLTASGAVEGTVTADAGDAIPGQATLASATFVMGGSGAPILLMETGTVVGLLVGADDPEAATVIDFIRLSLQTEESKAAGAGSEHATP